MDKATRIDEFTPDRVEVMESFTWLAVRLTTEENDFIQFRGLPKVAEYNGVRFYRMSYNSDKHEAYYKEAKDTQYHERYIL